MTIRSLFTRPAKALAVAVFAVVLFAGGAFAATAFNDVADNHPASAEITAAHQIGVFQGYGDGTFRPDGKLTQRQAENVVGRMLRYHGTDDDGNLEISRADAAVLAMTGLCGLDHERIPGCADVGGASLEDQVAALVDKVAGLEADVESLTADTAANGQTGRGLGLKVAALESHAHPGLSPAGHAHPAPPGQGTAFTAAEIKDLRMLAARERAARPRRLPAALEQARNAAREPACREAGAGLLAMIHAAGAPRARDDNYDGSGPIPGRVWRDGQGWVCEMSIEYKKDPDYGPYWWAYCPITVTATGELNEVGLPSVTAEASVDCDQATTGSGGSDTWPPPLLDADDWPPPAEQR